MVLIIRHMGRLIVACTVCFLLLSGFVSFFIPEMVEKASITTDDVYLEEPTVLTMSASKIAASGITIPSVLAMLENENTTELLDEQFWQSIQNDTGRVFAYKKIDGGYVKQEFVGSEPSDWMLVFTSENASGEKYKLKVNLTLN